MPIPHINSLSPNTGPVGTQVTIFGSNFNPTQGSSVVTFSTGKNATVQSWSNNQIVCFVPTGAVTGNVVVVVGAANSNGVTFTVTGAPPGPHITSLTPNSGHTLISCVIAGTNFGATQGSSTATFNGVVAAVTSWSDTSINAIVPATASTGPVIVTVLGVASNSVTFTVTTASNGGTSAPLNLFLIPASPGLSPFIYAFDPTSFDDPNNGSFYEWKSESITDGRSITVNRAFITYRDLGPATITLSLIATNDSGVVVTTSTTVPLGTAAASGKLCTTPNIGISNSGNVINARIDRAAGAGPVSIVKLRLEGQVSD
jgi:hypothetical protein